MGDDSPRESAGRDYDTAQLQNVTSALDGGIPSERTGAYRILECVGRGGMGVVYKAQQEHPIERIVALKLIKRGMDSDEILHRFESERQALALMSHPNVASVLDAGITESGRPYFVLEYVPGESITSFCDAHRLSIRQRLELFGQACEAVQHAHQRGILHRDLKPANILVTGDDSGNHALVKVIDFGVAKALHGSPSARTAVTETGQLIGTPEYMSPEQAGGEGEDIDTRSDIYSLGVVLYELLTGMLPSDPTQLRRGSAAEVRRLIRDSEPQRPSTRLTALGKDAQAIAHRRGTEARQLLRQLRSELEWIPLKAMRKDRAQRYRTAAEFAHDIRNYLERRPLLAGPQSRAYLLRKFLGRNRVSVTAAALVALALAIGGVAATVGFVRASRSAALARDEVDRASAVNQFLEEMLAAADPRISPGQRDLTVRKLVDDAAARIDAGSLRDRPQLEGAIRHTIGRTYARVGAYEPAERHLRRALELHRQTHGVTSLEAAEDLSDLGNLLRSRHRGDEAEPLLSEALAIRQQLRRTEHTDVAISLNNLALLMLDQNRNEEAEPLFRASLEMNRKLRGPQNVEVANVLSNLGIVVQRRGDIAQAEALQREALAVARASVGDVHPFTAEIISNLGFVLHLSGKFAEAEPFYRESIDIQRQLFGESHPELADRINQLAQLLHEQNKLAEAEPLYREGIAMSRRLLGERDAALSMPLHNYGKLLESMGRLEDAEAAMREGLEIQRRYPGSDVSRAIPMTSLALVLQKRNLWEESESLLREVLELRQRGLSVGHVLTVNTRSLLGGALAGQGKFAEAEALLVESYEQLKGDPKASAARIAAARERVARMYERWGKPQLAQRYTVPSTAPAASQHGG